MKFLHGVCNDLTHTGWSFTTVTFQAFLSSEYYLYFFKAAPNLVSIISMCQVNTVKGHTLNEAKLSSKTFLVPKQTEAKIESENKVTQAHWAPKWETNHGLLTDRAVTSNLQMRILFLFKRIVIARPLLFLQLVLQSTDSRGPGFRTQWAFMLQQFFFCFDKVTNFMITV